MGKYSLILWEFIPSKWGNKFSPARESFPTICGTTGGCNTLIIVGCLFFIFGLGWHLLCRYYIAVPVWEMHDESMRNTGFLWHFRQNTMRNTFLKSISHSVIALNYRWLSYKVWEYEKWFRKIISSALSGADRNRRHSGIIVTVYKEWAIWLHDLLHILCYIFYVT